MIRPYYISNPNKPSDGGIAYNTVFGSFAVFVQRNERGLTVDLLCVMSDLRRSISATNN